MDIFKVMDILVGDECEIPYSRSNLSNTGIGNLLVKLSKEYGDKCKLSVTYDYYNGLSNMELSLDFDLKYSNGNLVDEEVRYNLREEKERFTKIVEDTLKGGFDSLTLRLDFKGDGYVLPYISWDLVEGEYLVECISELMEVKLDNLENIEDKVVTVMDNTK